MYPSSSATGGPNGVYTSFPRGSSASTVEYTQLLQQFPQVLRREIQEFCQDLDQLKRFFQTFEANHWSLTETSVRFVLNAQKDRRSVERDDRRLSRLEWLSGATDERDASGLTPLHRAIFSDDIRVVKRCLENVRRAPASTLRPWQRPAECTRMPEAALKIGELESQLSKPAPHQAEKLTPEQYAKQRNEILALAIIGTNARNAPEGVLAHAGDNALTFAISAPAKYDVLEALILHCATHCPDLLDAPDANGNPPLVAAAAAGNLDALKLLLAKPELIDINQRNGRRRNALMEAAHRGDEVMLTLLLDQGAVLTQRDTLGRTAMQLAAVSGYPKLYNQLAEKAGTDQQAIEAIKQDIVAVAQRRDAPVLRGLLAEQTKGLGLEGMREVLRAALAVRDNAEVILCLLRQDNAPGATPGTHEPGKGNPEPSQTSWTLQQLVSGLELQAVDAAGLDAMASVVLPPFAKDCDATLRDGLLRHASKVGSVKCVDYALNAEVDHIEAGLDAALRVAVEAKECDVFFMLIKAWDRLQPDPSASLQQLAWAAKLGSVEACRHILQQRQLDMPRAAALRTNPLLQALKAGHLPVLEVLLQYGANSFARNEGRFRSAVQEAVAQDNEAALKVLLDKDVHLAAELRRALPGLLQRAKRSQSRKCFNVLVSAGMRFGPSRRVLSQRLQLSATLGSADACETLLKAGADAGYAPRGRTPLESAMLSETPDWATVALLAGKAKEPAHGSELATVIVDTLMRVGASDEQKIRWLALCLAHSFDPAISPQLQKWYSNLRALGEHLKPLARSILSMKPHPLKRAYRLAWEMLGPVQAPSIEKGEWIQMGIERIGES